MSYDLTIYTNKEIKFPKEELDRYNLTYQDGIYTAQGKRWQLYFNDSEFLEKDEIPDQVRKFQKGIKYSTGMIVEPLNMPDEAFETMVDVCEYITHSFDGIVEDHQGSNLHDYKGRTENLTTDKRRVAAIEMSWYFMDDTKFEGKGFSLFLDILEKHMPEAMPMCYGDLEKRKYTLKSNGRKHFEEFAMEMLHHHDLTSWFNWQTRKPVKSVSIDTINPNAHNNHNKFESNYFQMLFLKSDLKKSQFKKRAYALWIDLVTYLSPFYSEVRVLKGHSVQGNTLYSHGLTEINPTCLNSWKGIPKQLGTAMSLGKEYQKLWPKAASKMQKINESQSIVSLDDWGSKSTVNTIVGRVPKEIRQIIEPCKVRDEYGGYSSRYNDKFPKMFPFKIE